LKEKEEGEEIAAKITGERWSEEKKISGLLASPKERA